MPGLDERRVFVLLHASVLVAAAYAGLAWLALVAAWTLATLLDSREYLDGVSAIQYVAVPSSYVHGVMIVRGSLSGGAVEEYVGTRLAIYPRFRQRILWPRFWWPYWKEDPEFDVYSHVEERKERCDHAQLEQFLSTSCASLLPSHRPPYRFYVFPNYVDEGGARGSAVVFKYHHAMADGVTMLRTLFQASDEDARANVPPPKPRSRPPTPSPSLGRTLATGAAAAGKMVLMGPDPHSVLKEGVFMRAHMQLCTRFHTMGVPLDDVKAASRALGASVNDVLVAALTGALRRLSERKSRPLESAKAVVWVSLHPLSALFRSIREVPLTWGNQGLGAIYLPLPFRAAAQRASAGTVRAVQRLTSALIHSPEPLFAHALMAFFGRLHPAVSVPIWDKIAYKASLSFSNMPGPQFSCKLLGRELTQLVFFVPPAGTLGLFTTLFTYNGRITVGLCSGVGVRTEEDAHVLVHKALEEELRSILKDADEGKNG